VSLLNHIFISLLYMSFW